MKKYGNRNIVTVDGVTGCLTSVDIFMLYIVLHLYISIYWFFVHCVK
jgi:hypothetical protein